jgi:NAD(P)-dependent dehydrogenase (short-subunit alcohol dehydrogenase family)
MDKSSLGIAVVTGAGGAIGGEIARKLSSDGYTVVCVDVNADNVSRIAQELPGSLSFSFDITCESSILDFRDSLANTIGHPNIIVNAAGIFFLHDIDTLSEEDFDRIIGVNLKGTFLMCKTFIPGFIEAGKGNIINIASTAGLVGGTNRAVYCASKAGVVLFTRSLAIDYGAKGIRANCVCPGLIDTPMASWLQQDTQAFERWEKSIPAQRVGNVEDIASAVSYLASDESSYIYGSSLVVDGGGLA